MPSATRRRPLPQPPPPPFADSPSDTEAASEDEVAVHEALIEHVGADEDDEEHDGHEETDPSPPHSPTLPPLPPNLKEISSLASWTVSTSKPGCSVAQLRNPSTNLFWQSDGPQPHTLNIHFFKMVEICAMRIYLDFEQDESYTPTKIAFLAGTGEWDLQEWALMTFEQPRGWIDVDFEGVGPADEEDAEDEDEDGLDEDEDGASGRRRRMLPILRAMLVQVKILENHQNGKDTHLRGLQIFAKDKVAASAPGLPRENVSGLRKSSRRRRRRNVMEPEWALTPELR